MPDALNLKLKVEEEAALEILLCLQSAQDNELFEPASGHAATLSFKENNEEKKVRVRNYAAGRAFCLQHKWIAEHNGLISITTAGTNAIEDVSAGRYRTPRESGKELDLVRTELFKHKGVAPFVLIISVLAFLISVANQVVDFKNKISTSKSSMDQTLPQTTRMQNLNRPDVELILKNPQAPTLSIKNRSEVLAREIKWAFGIWNSRNLNQPIPIPSQTFDWLKAGETSGPLKVVPSTSLADIHEGDIVFGSMAESCTECERGRTYLIYIDWGKEGWYAEVPQERKGNLLVPYFVNKRTLQNFLAQIRSVPTDRRKNM